MNKKVCRTCGMKLERYEREFCEFCKDIKGYKPIGVNNANSSIRRENIRQRREGHKRKAKEEKGREMYP